MKEEVLTITSSLEYIKLWKNLEIVEREYKSIYSEFHLDPTIADIYYKSLKIECDDHCWLEAIDWATTLAQNVRFDLLENGIDIEVMNTLMSNLLELIETARKKQLRELRG